MKSRQIYNRKGVDKQLTVQLDDFVNRINFSMIFFLIFFHHLSHIALKLTYSIFKPIAYQFVNIYHIFVS